MPSACFNSKSTIRQHTGNMPKACPYVMMNHEFNLPSLQTNAIILITNNLLRIAKIVFPTNNRPMPAIRANKYWRFLKWNENYFVNLCSNH